MHGVSGYGAEGYKKRRAGERYVEREVSCGEGKKNVEGQDSPGGEGGQGAARKGRKGGAGSGTVLCSTRRTTALQSKCKNKTGGEAHSPERGRRAQREHRRNGKGTPSAVSSKYGG